MYKRLIGDAGERQAAAYLRRHKYKIADTNYSSRFGEIDIIAQKDGYTVFVEVKKRKNDSFGGGAAAVTRAKQRRIIITAEDYLQKKSLDCPVRFDVIEINDDALNHIENAFTAEGFF